jgi:2-oxoglutarate ferredoxin oxidoreductase subunit beta
MSELRCSFLNCGVDDDREFDMEDYEGSVSRWCRGCGDHGILTAVERLLEAAQLKPERTVFVSGIGCASRFPHYLDTYGFHGIHGRALPVATGIKLRRPDLDVFVVMGDGDCCSIGAGHWMHAIRYNMDMVVLLLDNGIYGLTKNQASPTTPKDFFSNTTPRGAYLEALDPLSATLGITNASFVAQTADWVPAHLYATLEAAHNHRGLSFVRILQRCPQFSAPLFDELVRQPDRIELLVHENGVTVPDLEMIYKNVRRHDPGDIDAARRMAEPGERFRLGVLFHDASKPRYEETREQRVLTAEEKIGRLSQEFDRYAV